MAGQVQQSTLLGKIAAYTEILAKDPESTIFVSLSEAYRKAGMFDDARKIAVAGLANHPDFTPAHIVLARILCQQEDYQGSADHFERALQLDGTNLAAFVGYARLNILLDQEDRARELLLEARKYSPADSTINKLLLSLPDAPRPDVVVAEEAAEVEESPAAPVLASATLAGLYLKQGLEDQALEMYRRLSEQDPNNLALRRKIRDLEERLSPPPLQETEVGAKPQKTVEAVSAGAAEPASAESDFSQDAVAEQLTAVEMEQRGAANVDVRPGPEVVIDRLNQWLDNIQQRRGDV